MVTVGIGFAIVSFFLSSNPFQSSSKETEEPTSVAGHTSSPRIDSIPERSRPVLQVEPAEKNDTLTASENESINKELPEENTPEELPNLSSNGMPSNEEQETAEETEKKSYPVGDFRRLTPQERIRYHQIVKEFEDLDRKGKALLGRLTPGALMRIKRSGKEHPETPLIKRRKELYLELAPLMRKLGYQTVTLDGM